MTTKLGLGMAAIGRPHYINIRQEQVAPFDLEGFRQKGRAVLDVAYASGLRYFDTAPGYGLAEQLLLDWAHEKQDASIEVATKWGYTYTANFDANATQHEVKEHSLSKLKEQWAQSQKLLPYLSTYQIHSATFETGVLENAAVLGHLAQLKEKQALRMGLSTTGANQVEVLEKALEVEVDGVALFEVFQVTYNVLDQSLFDIGKQIVEAGKRLVIKEALANGRVFPNPAYPQYEGLYAILGRLAEAHQVGIDAIALRFCIDTLQPFKVLSGAANKLHIEQNLQAETFTLAAANIDLLQSFATDPLVYWPERKQLKWN